MIRDAWNRSVLRATLIVSVAALAWVMLALLIVAPVQADTHTVTNTLDTGIPGSLRRAIQAASSGDTIVFSPTVFSIPRTITLSQGMIVISKALSIDGSIGAGVYTPTISGGNTTSLFQIAISSSLALQRVRLINGACDKCYGGAILNMGLLNLNSTQFFNNRTNWYGGAIYNYWLLTITNSSFISNYASLDGGAVYYLSSSSKSSIVNTSFTGNTASGQGGAIFNEGPLSITNSNLISNSAADGGAIYHSRNTLSVVSTTLNNNRASRDGGAIHTDSKLTLFNSSLAANTAIMSGGAVSIGYFSTANISNTTFRANQSSDSAGAISNSGTLNLTASLLISNTAINGGALDNAYGKIIATQNTFTDNSADWGGAIVNQGTLDMNNSTITGNSAKQLGGGIWNYRSGDGVYLVNCTLAGNSAKFGGSLFIEDNIVLKNTIVTTGTTGIPCLIDSGEVITDGGHNLDTGNSCGFIAAAPQRSLIYVSKPRLGALQLNPPGSTPTMMLLPGSPAIDAGNKSTCPPVDQRGVPRSGTYCDIGAYEANWRTKTFVPFIKRK